MRGEGLEHLTQESPVTSAEDATQLFLREYSGVSRGKRAVAFKACKG